MYEKSDYRHSLSLFLFSRSHSCSGSFMWVFLLLALAVSGIQTWLILAITSNIFVDPKSVGPSDRCNKFKVNFTPDGGRVFAAGMMLVPISFLLSFVLTFMLKLIGAEYSIGSSSTNMMRMNVVSEMLVRTPKYDRSEWANRAFPGIRQEWLANRLPSNVTQLYRDVTKLSSRGLASVSAIGAIGTALSIWNAVQVGLKFRDAIDCFNSGTLLVPLIMTSLCAAGYGLLTLGTFKYQTVLLRRVKNVFRGWQLILLITPLIRYSIRYPDKQDMEKIWTAHQSVTSGCVLLPKYPEDLVILRMLVESGDKAYELCSRYDGRMLNPSTVYISAMLQQ